MSIKARLILAVVCLAAVPLFAQSRMANDISRLSAILLDSQNEKVTISADAWRVTGNEVNALANRIAANARGKKAARELQTHVHEMRDAALKGDADGARSHAGMALPYLYQLSQ